MVRRHASYTSDKIYDAVQIESTSNSAQDKRSILLTTAADFPPGRTVVELVPPVLAVFDSSMVPIFSANHIFSINWFVV